MQIKTSASQSIADLRERIGEIYRGPTKRSVRFRYGLLTFDFLTISFFTISFFIVSSFAADAAWLLPADIVIGVILAVELGARFFIARSRWRFLLEKETIADIIVILSLLSVAIVGNFAFLRALRALRILHSYRMLRDLRREHTVFRQNEEVIQNVLNLFVFVFMVTAVVYVAQSPSNPAISNYVDALYFTVSTLTTTGFGDITLTGSSGRLLAVIIMVFGVALFLRLAQSIFRPSKVNYDCPDCGLSRHEPDAVHCKHCGRVIKIGTKGA
jgi:voltage-gated potassium channel